MAVAKGKKVWITLKVTQDADDLWSGKVLRHDKAISDEEIFRMDRVFGSEFVIFNPESGYGEYDIWEEDLKKLMGPEEFTELITLSFLQTMKN